MAENMHILQNQKCLCIRLGLCLLSKDYMYVNVPCKSWPHDHKLRKYLSIKLDFEYLKFYWTHCFNKLQI